MVEPNHPDLSLRRQCQLISLNRSSWYYAPATESPMNLTLMRLIDQQYTQTPFYGYPRMTVHLRQQGYPVNPKRVFRLMQQMGIQAVYPKPRTTTPHPHHTVYPYLLCGVRVSRPNQVWAADITYIPMRQGFMYLVVILDWFSRYVISWALSNTLDGHFCLEALQAALATGQPDIFNTDQGVQFTARAFVGCLQAAQVRVSMAGRGRAFDNIFVERFWRTVKYEDIYLKEYETVPALYTGLGHYLSFYNNDRPHQSLADRTPAAVYFGC